MRVPEPKPFGGAWNTKDLENFLWDMEQYFIASRIPVGEQVTITTMYLTGDAKLWWRTRMSDDAAAGRPKIESWEILKKELKDRFLPTNTTWMARVSLKKLKQTGSFRDYVKEFSSLILDIKDMSEVDKLFNFMSRLQGWAQTELRRQGVQDLPSAMAAADCLSGYRLTSPLLPPKRGKATTKSQNGSQMERTLRVEARVGRSRRIYRLKWGRGRPPHKLPGRRDASSVIGHIERGIAQRRRSLMHSWPKTGKIAGQRSFQEPTLFSC